MFRIIIKYLSMLEIMIEDWESKSATDFFQVKY